MLELKRQLMLKVEHHQMMERNARIYKMQTIGYHKAKAEAFQQTLAMIQELNDEGN
jgi:hypothetical protein